MFFKILSSSFLLGFAKLRPNLRAGQLTLQINDINAFIQATQQAEEARAPLRNYLNELSAEFQQHLAERYSPKTVRKQSGIVDLFIDFICRYTDVNEISEITRGMVNTHFRKWWKKKVWDSTTENELRVALRKFFNFLDEEITNEKVLQGLHEHN